MLAPLCRGVFTQKLGVTAYPGALFYRIVQPHGLLGLRVSSVVVVALWFAATWRATRGNGFASFVALHAFGLLPLTIVSARGEPMMLVCFGAIAALVLRRPPRSWHGRAWRAVLFVLLGSIVFATHPRALLYTPFLIASSLLAFGRRRWVWGAMVAIAIAITAGQTYGVAKASTACPNGPKVEAILRSLTAPPSTLVRSPSVLAHNLVSFGEVMATSMSFVSEPDNYRWLPNDPATWLSPKMVTAADRLTHVGLLSLYIGMPSFVVLGAWRSRRRPGLRRRALLAVLLTLAALATAGINTIAAFYNVPGVMPVLALACLLVAPTFEAVRRVPRVLAASVLQLAALVSLSATIANMGPRLVALAERPGVVYPDRPASLHTLNASSERAKIRAHAKSCGIQGDGASHLVVDDETIFAFDDLHDPIHLIYISDGAMWGTDYPGRANVDLMQRVGASGLVTRCRFLPTALESRVHRDGDYCCLAPVAE